MSNRKLLFFGFRIVNNTVTLNGGSAVKLHWPSEGAEISDSLFEDNAAWHGSGGAIRILQTNSEKVDLPASIAFKKGSAIVSILRSNFTGNQVVALSNHSQAITRCLLV